MALSAGKVRCRCTLQWYTQHREMLLSTEVQQSAEGEARRGGVGARWSMSHSAGHAALALGWGVDALGVNLEHTRARPFEDLLPAFARPEEEAWWQQSPDPGQAFYRL